MLTALLLASAWTFAAQAGETTFKGVSVDYGDASTNWVDGDLVLAYTSARNDALSLGGCVQARVLLVGGGGSGSSGGGTKQSATGYAGKGGTVVEKLDVLLDGNCTIAIGAGGSSVTGSKYGRTNGKPGSRTTISSETAGIVIFEAAGGEGGGSSTPGDTTVTSDITGTSTAYGQNGGKGANSQASSGAGGAGVVIVRLTGSSPLISGRIRVGAYEVDVQNASRTNWVDGELVVTYLNTDAFVAKSFTLPQPTMGRLLAVGGGGAGGQDTAEGFSSSYGLPGGGGAGGLVIKDEQVFEAKTYEVSVGVGGAEVGRKLDGDVLKPISGGKGVNGGDSVVKQGEVALVTAKGGGGGGRRSEGNPGGSGGGGSADYSSKVVQSKSGGSGESGQGNAGGTGGNARYGAGGGGAGAPGSDTTSIDRSKDPTTIDVNVSFEGGPGRFCDITGENVEYARGGAGGVPRVYGYFYTNYVNGVCTTNFTSDTGKVPSGCRGYTFEAKDGKPGRDGYGDGGGGSGQEGYTGSNPTFAGRGGSGVVIVRIPPYSISAEDALKEAFEGQLATVSGSQVTLIGDVSGPIGLPDNIGAVTIDLAGHAIVGADGAAGDPVDIMPGGDGEPAIRLVPHVYTCEAGRTQVKVRGSGELVGGNGGNGYPGGRCSAAVARAAGVGTDVTVDTGTASQTSGADGETYVQHEHVWTYKQVGNEIHATCVATDGEPCSYKNPEYALKIVLHADDVEFTGARYDSAGVVNGILPVVGIPTGVVFYEGREDKGTVYPKSATPPTDAGYYLATLTFNGMTMEKDFSIIEGKMQQDTVYQSTKTAVRSGSDVLITLRASYDGAKAINYGNVLFLGSRCSAHSMKAAALAGAINALTPFASVQWYAYGSTDPTENKSGFTAKGQQVKESEFTLVGANHFVYDRMMDDLYAELVENKNNRAYDMVILEFDGDLLGRNHLAPYQLTYILPDGWTDGKAAILRTAMAAFYDANRVVWIVPKVDASKKDYGHTGAYPWTSKPEFVWQRALLNATEKTGYRCPLQKNYEDADELISFMQQALIGAYFKKVKITDTIADGLSFSKDDVATEFRDLDGLWKNACPSAVESRYGTTITATKTVNGRTVAVEFDTSAFQAEALRREALVNNDVRVTIRARIEDEFFAGLGGGAPKDTNVGDATFVYSGGEDVGDFTNNVPPASIPNVKPNPIYEARDYVGYYDAEGHTITVTVIDPDPAVKTPDIRYSLEKDGSYDKNLLLTNVCEAVDVWFTLTAEGYATVTNYAKVTIRPRVVELTAEDATKAYDGDPLTTNGFTVASVTPDDYTQGKGFVPGEGIDKVTMTDDSQQTEVGNHPNVINPAKSTMTPKTGTDLDNYIVITHPGTLTVTPPLSMGIEAFPAEKFYDAEATNIIYVVTNATGAAIADATISLREKGTDTWIPAADFVPYVDTTNVIVEVRAEKSGFTPVEAEATVLVKPRPVTLIAASDSKVYDGLPLTNWTFSVKEDTTTPGYGFVKEEGVDRVTMTAASTVTDPGSQPNVIATEVAKDGTKLERNYVVSTEPGTLTVTKSEDGLRAKVDPYADFYDGDPHTITVAVTEKPKGSDPTISYSLEQNGTYAPYVEFAWPKDVTNLTVYAKVSLTGYEDQFVSSTVTILPRVVVQKAGDASKDFDGTPLRCDDSDEEPGRELEEAEKLYGADGADAIGFVSGEGFATVPMTADSEQIEPGTHTNLIDMGAVTLVEGTSPDNYVFFFDPGLLTVIQRQEEVRRDPEVEIPEESKAAVEKSDRKIEKTLDEMAKADQEVSGEVYVKYQLTMTPTNNLDETTRTTPEKAAEDAKEQIELAESETGSKIDKVEFVDIVLERTYSKEEAEATEAGNYNKDNWEPLDKAEEHGNRLFEVVIPVEVPEGMELIGVTRSCDNKGTEILRPKNPNDPNAEGFVYDPETKTVTLYARDFCVFGFMMKEKSGCMGCPWGYKVAIVVRTTVANSVSNVYAHACGCYRKPTVGKLVGYVWGATEEGIGTCGDGTCGCNAWSSGRIALWKAWNGAAYPVESMAMQQLDRIGAMKDRSTAELLWTVRPADPGAGNTVGAALHLAGFGKCAHRADGTVAIKNANGFVAGQMFSYCQDSTEQVCGDPIEGEAVPSHCWALCEDAAVPEIEDQNLTVAYGKWKMEWDSKLVSRIKGKSVDTLVKPTAKYEDNPGTTFGN